MKPSGYLSDNAWVWAGTALVLLTLSGPTLRNAMIIAVGTTLVHFVASTLNEK